MCYLTDLVKRIIKALKEPSGASSEYQTAIFNLKCLKHTLQFLQSSDPVKNNVKHISAIHAIALASLVPIRRSVQILSKYEPSLEPWAVRVIGLKAEVEKFSTLVAANQISINLLLATHAS